MMTELVSVSSLGPQSKKVINISTFGQCNQSQTSRGSLYGQGSTSTLSSILLSHLKLTTVWFQHSIPHTPKHTNAPGVFFLGGELFSFSELSQAWE